MARGAPKGQRSEGAVAVIRRTERLDAVERRYSREKLGSLSYQEALCLFSALWNEARHLNPSFTDDWKSDIEPDLAIARVLNGLPPHS